jgi:arylesterase / paraoxonase
LWLYDYTQAHDDVPLKQLIKPFTFVDYPNENDFQPLGLDYEPEESALYVVNHATTGSVIDIFQLDLAAATATFVKTFKHPLIHAPNSIHALGHGRLYVTNDHFIRSEVSYLLSQAEMYLGLPGGTVVYTDTNDAESTKVVARVAFANGITMLNATTLAVASSTAPGVYLYEVQPDYNVTSRVYIRTDVSVDNLSVDSAGALLLAGHPFSPQLTQVASNRVNCDPQSQDEAKRKACDCISPSWAAEWTEKNGLRTLYKGYDFCSSATAVRDVKRGVGLLGGLYANGVMLFRV